MQGGEAGHGLFVDHLAGHVLVDGELGAGRGAVIAKGAPDHVVARRRSDLVIPRPGDGEAAAGQGRHRGLVLRTVGGGVDQELGAQRVVIDVVDPGVDAVAAAVQAGLILPDDHVVAVAQIGDGRVLLGAAGGAVDHLLGAVDRSPVRLGGDVDGDGPGRRHAAVAVGQAQRNGAAGFGVGQRVGVGQVLDQRLGRFRRGIGVEHHGQRLAVDPV
ncbi:MAG: hypothetical protein AW07_01304 [Candidatus Accumulibacter sp. SK-11]|nr:MAG: hypothetical protein AW07_01304 [Candidatus Accumulibacter sp. SK-11]